MYGEHYIERLKREIAEQREKRAAEAASATLDPREKLKDRITQWYNSLAPEARAPHYFVEYLARQLHATPQQLAVALRELGWRCERVWRKGEAYRHYWIPPAVDLPEDSDSQASSSTTARDVPTT